MARSTYVYLLINELDKVIATFTVKHEAINFWKRHLNSDSTVTMHRFSDGHLVPSAIVPWENEE